MNKNGYIEKSEKYLLKTYSRFEVVFKYGKSVYLYDTDNNEYLDFASGIGVMGLGYGNTDFENAIINQIKNITHTSNLYYNVPMSEASEKVIKATGMSKVFFTNSGAEAIEGAIKTAKKYFYLKNGSKDYEIIAMNNSFHGRTIGALSVTGTEKYRKPFYPLMSGVKFADFNNFDSIINNITENTCAIIMETVQGEGGIYPADKEFLQKVRKLCNEKEIILILDEIQCGMGRTGTMFAYQQYDILPDIMTTAKALGNGLPVGAFVMTDKVAKNSMIVGDHGSTYGGNPLCMSAISTVFDIFEKEKILENVNSVYPYFEKILNEFVDKYDFVKSRRGKGLMQGLILTIPVKDVVKKALLEEKLVLLSAGSDVLRILPPLIIQKNHIDEFKNKLEKVFNSFL